MIDGMQIIKTTELAKTNAEILFIGTFFAIFAALFCIVFGIYFFIEKEHKIGIILTISACFLGILSFAVGNRPITETPTGVFEYEVICHTNDAFAEMYKKYDIISENHDYEDSFGVIYTIKEKETSR